MTKYIEAIVEKARVRELTYTDVAERDYSMGWKGHEPFENFLETHEANAIDYLNEIIQELKTAELLTSENLLAILNVCKYEQNLSVIKSIVPNISMFNCSLQLLQDTELLSAQNIKKMLVHKYEPFDAFQVMLFLMRAAGAMEQHFFDELLSNGPIFRKAWYNTLESNIRDFCELGDINFEEIDIKAYVTRGNLEITLNQTKSQFDDLGEDQYKNELPQAAINPIIRFKNIMELREYCRVHPDYQVSNLEWKKMMEYHFLILEHRDECSEEEFYDQIVVAYVGRNRQLLINEELKKKLNRAYSEQNFLKLFQKHWRNFFSTAVPTKDYIPSFFKLIENLPQGNDIKKDELYLQALYLFHHTHIHDLSKRKEGLYWFIAFCLETFLIVTICLMDKTILFPGVGVGLGLALLVSLYEKIQTTFYQRKITELSNTDKFLMNFF